MLERVPVDPLSNIDACRYGTPVAFMISARKPE